MGTILIRLLDNNTLSNIFRQRNSFLIILKTCKDLIRIPIEQADKSDPLIFIILETHNIAFKFLRTNLDDFWK